MKRIQIPQGMRDLISDECEKKELLQKNIEKIFASFGYQKIATPAIEYYDTYQNGFAAADEEEMYKFFDQDGRILTLRADMTVPIARVCASKFANAKPPFRLSYASDVFKVRHTFAGKRSEVTDCGIECIGLDESSDIEIIYTAVQVMKVLGVNQWKLEIGNSRFFSAACEEVSLSREDTVVLADLIDRKALPELNDYLNTLSISAEAISFFTALPLLTGEEDALKEAEKISFTEDLKKEVEKLSDLYEELKELKSAENVTFDFGKVPHLDYYTGIIFEGYITGVGSSVLSGGRYDNLLGKFGRDLPACGFSVKLDYVIDGMNRIENKKMILKYPKGKETEAILKASQLREEGNDVEMIPWDKESMEVAK